MPVGKTIKKKITKPKTQTQAAMLPFDGKVHLTQDERERARDRMLMAGDGSIGRDINYMIQSRFKIIYIRTFEERRVVDFFKDLSIHRGADLFRWDCDRGLLNAETKKQIVTEDSEVHESPIAMLAHIIDHANKQCKTIINKERPTEESIYILLDFHTFMEGIPQVERKLREIAETISSTVVIIISPVFVCPPTLEKDITLVDFPVPSYKEINASLLKIGREISNKLPNAYRQAKENEEDLVKAASGLTLNEAENAYAMTIVKDRKFNIQTILDEKKQMIRKSGILEYRDSRFTMDDLGGLDTLKDWLSLRRLAFKEDARQFGLPLPKGLLILGIPGSGKSAMCDALADLYQMPLLRLDFGAIFASHVGESEQNIRQCLQVAEAIAPCIEGSTSININGVSLKVEDLFLQEESDSKNKVTESKDGSQKVAYINPDKRIIIKGVDKDGLSKNLKVKALIRTRKRERLIKIKTKSSKEIITTQDHMLLAGDKKMKKSKDFIIGEVVMQNNTLRIVEDTIESIEEIDFDGYVYDVSCENPHLYLTNGFVSHNCIFWVDEVEKGIGGVQSSNSTDGGVTNRVFGTMLTWMQDKEAPVFVVCTANNIDGIPPEFMRAGRFDEIFFIDLPDPDGRKEVTEKLLRRKGRQSTDFDISAIALASENYTPVEIEKGIDNALFAAYADNKRQLLTEDIVQSLSSVHPLYDSRREDIQRMREWALGKDGVGGRAILANSPSVIDSITPDENVGRMIDLDLSSRSLP